MKKLLLRTFKFLLMVLFPGLLFAQGNPDYSVLFNAGKFTPQENSKTLNKDSEVIRGSLFQNKHYVTLQFYSLPNQATKDKMQTSGVQLIDYIPNLAYTASLKTDLDPSQLKNFGVRSVFQLSPAQKTVPALLQKDIPAHAIPQKGLVDVTVITYEKLNTKTVGQALQKVKAVVLQELPMFRSFTVRVPQANVAQLVALPFVQWVEFIDAPNVSENLLGRTLHRVNVLNDGVRNLKGDSINIGIWDGGEVSPHIDFSPVATRLQIMETSQPESHGTHCAGTIAGRGLINPKARGMAPNAKLFSYNFSGNIPSEMSTAIPLHNLAVSSHSYGSTQTCGVTGAGVAYSSTSRNTDLNLNTNPSHLHVHSAGNSQTACSGGWSTITGSGKTAKNNILVANITSTEAISGSSSFGPVHDGRVKPEISSFGTNVLSTYTPLNTYGTISGTSMATPGVAGTVALLVQRYKQLHSTTAPISSLIKAVLCNTAQDLGNAGPDYKFGFGRLNALNAVRAIEQNRYALNTITTGVTNDITITIPAGTARLNVMLAWNDPAGTANSSTALINNLNLSVISASGSTLPWILNATSPANAATRGVDNVSNIEQVTIANPTAGTYTLRVNGASVPSGANQQYAVTWEIDQPYIEVIYPNGEESLSPGAQEMITWNNAGITSNQTVQYSLDNGSTWTTLASNVTPATTRYNWTLPSGANTATALVRVFSGSVTDISDLNFKILGTPASLSGSAGICGGSLAFTWPAVTNATHYDLLQLDAATGNWVPLASNITGTSYTASGLTPNASMWFSLRSRNNLTGAISERCLAINRVVPASGGGLTLDPISGATILCSGAQNISYSVPAARGVSGYSWSVPTGSTSISGQGRNGTGVKYPAGNITGTVTVEGSTGTCMTSPQSLSVSTNNQISPPASGGDQTICANTSANSLFASASAPSGFNLLWYTTPTGGTAISNPDLRQPGTVTYYAASQNPNGNCESTTRTPVTLTINSVPTASITASGPTTFCEGNSVSITASPGASYLWSNGETTQTIYVDKAGSYSVTTTQATGCSSTSAAENVMVTPKPTLSLSAEPATQLTPGISTTLKASGNYDNSARFVWKKDGIVIPNETSSTLRVAVPEMGDYTVEISTAQGCTTTSNRISLTAAEITGAFIYPKPNNGKFQVRYYIKPGVTTTNSIEVYDSKGALVKLQASSVKQAYDRMDVDMSERKGVFWVLLKDADGKEIASGKVILQ